MPTTTHAITIEDTGTAWARVCSCGYRSADWLRKHYRTPAAADITQPCPFDDTPNALVTCQMAWGGLFDAKPVGNVHLVRSAPCGTPGPTLCGVDRFGQNAPGWSIGGGVDGPGMVHTPCTDCARVAREDFPGLPVHGMAALVAPLVAAINAERATR
jgi:hypothetical protein